MVATMKRHALTLTEFDQHLQFSFCRSCEAHIALQSDFAGADATYSKAIFLDAVNVVIDGPNRHHMEGTDKVADVHCTRCNTLLGSQYIEVENSKGRVRAGRFGLFFNKLRFWNGSAPLAWQ
ncbi:protein yippee-like At4g27745 isoform X1 [Cornus florida]|uniref:protein yippee-like At4g27745 isoform X1 n=2 Tax=Cornus florida TaxID=4283 RepID=UPI0028A04ED6|nr:protein yippee-like At4g27745 isoform X1 [Cornus florida]